MNYTHNGHAMVVGGMAVRKAHAGYPFLEGEATLADVPFPADAAVIDYGIFDNLQQGPRESCPQ